MKFGRNFFSRKAAYLTEAQKDELAKWEAQICGDSLALRPAVDADLSRLLEILENRKADLQKLGKSSLKDCFVRNESNKDKDSNFGRSFFCRKAGYLTQAQKDELAKWEAQICGDSVALRPAVHSEFGRLLEILENRKADLQKLGKSSLKDCFVRNESNKDKDLNFGRNFFSRNAGYLTESQEQELAELEVEICKTVNFDHLTVLFPSCEIVRRIWPCCVTQISLNCCRVGRLQIRISSSAEHFGIEMLRG